jgi:hypothetical protein
LREAEKERLLKEYRAGKSSEPLGARTLIPAGVVLTVAVWFVMTISG